MTLASRPLSMTINGRAVGPIDVPDDMMMIDFLHEFLNLTGSRMGCGQGICYACTVAVTQPDGSLREMRTCITGAHFFAGRSVHTVEGWAERDSRGGVVALSPVQQAFIEHYAFQCGYCTPGFVTGATVLMDRTQAHTSAPSGPGTGDRGRARPPHLPMYRLRSLLRGCPAVDP